MVKEPGEEERQAPPDRPALAGFRSAPRWRVADDCQNSRKLAGVRVAIFLVTPLPLRLGAHPSFRPTPPVRIGDDTP